MLFALELYTEVLGHIIPPKLVTIRCGEFGVWLKEDAFFLQGLEGELGEVFSAGSPSSMEFMHYGPHNEFS